MNKKQVNKTKVKPTKKANGKEPEPVTAATDDWGETAQVTVAVQDSDGTSVSEDTEWDVTPTVDPADITLLIERHAGVFDPATAKWLIYGETGTHKTRTAATFPQVLFLDVDHGMSSVDWEVDKISITDGDEGFAQMKAAYEFLKTGDHEYTTVVLDTLNEMQRVIMRYTIEEFQGRIKRSYGNLPGQSDYGKMLYEFIELTRNFIALPMRVVLLAQVNSQQFDTDTLMPQLIGKNTARDLARKMDIIGYISKQNDEDGNPFPVIRFDSGVYITKDRSNLLPAEIDYPSYEKLSQYLGEE